MTCSLHDLHHPRPFVLSGLTMADLSPRNKISLPVYFFTVLLLFAAFTVVFNSQSHGKIYDDLSQAEAILRQSFQGAKSVESSEGSFGVPDRVVEEDGYRLAGLSCQAYGGPSDDVAQEMVYWEDIETDSEHVSPLKKDGYAEYMTFEPDAGGFNNIRMAFETSVALAFATGRTLVLPPEKELYLLGKSSGEHGSQRNKFGFNHFFHMDAIHQEHAGLDIITTEEFLQREAMTGNLQDSNGKVTFPPQNRTLWNGKAGELKPYFDWLRGVSHLTLWDPNDCLAVIPKTTDPDDAAHLLELGEKVKESNPNWEDYVGKPVPVDASTEDRMKENWAQRKKVCLYDQEMQASRIIHFPVDHSMGARLLTHFYSFVFFEDWKEDLWMKRFVRDHVRYIDEIQCAAARVIEAVRNRARSRDPTNNPEGHYDAFHVRRGDFQYKKTRVDADVLLKMAQRKIKDGATLYIGTDERDKNFFQPLKEHYDVVFLDDFFSELGKVNTNYFGMIDQLITSRGRIFYGCWFSTFTGYINRIRGYHASKRKAPGYEEGIVEDTYYYALEDRFDHMLTYYPVKQSFFAREFPTSWRLLDFTHEH